MVFKIKKEVYIRLNTCTDAISNYVLALQMYKVFLANR